MGPEVLTQWVWAGPRVCVSSQFSGDADGAGPRAALRGRGPAGRRERRGGSAPGSRRLRPQGEPTAGGIQTLGPGRGRSGAAGAGRERELGRCGSVRPRGAGLEAEAAREAPVAGAAEGTRGAGGTRPGSGGRSLLLPPGARQGPRLPQSRLPRARQRGFRAPPRPPPGRRRRGVRRDGTKAQ